MQLYKLFLLSCLMMRGQVFASQYIKDKTDLKRTIQAKPPVKRWPIQKVALNSRNVNKAGLAFKPKNKDQLTLREVIWLIREQDFSYDKQGGYVQVLEQENNNGYFKETLAGACTELAHYYKIKGKEGLATRAFELVEKYAA